MERRTDTRRPATPEEISARIRSEHAEISALVARVEALSERVSSGADVNKTIVALREELQGLASVLLEHLHYEEYQLPTLAPDGEADQMAEDMRREHRAQRELLDRVIRELDETAVGSKLVVGVRELARAIRDDMEHEEHELLTQS
ncbi:MAG: hypothetical protein AMJ62_01615 [Myxococcales bacterium SG8_38]|nr:MAG: hypothetical protein AMJ62_01615 [Myxococcales bacterium SG8_38]